MRIDLACFSDRGNTLAQALARKLSDGGDMARVTRCGADIPLRKWVAAHFHETDAVIFIGSVGIAVRAIAPEIVSKTSDPAAVVVDESGRFAISLVSGHIGGANALAERVAVLLGAMPVITTATDINKVFAIDAWAARNGLAIVNPEKIKVVSSRLLSGNCVRVESAFSVEGMLPAGIVLAENDSDVLIDIHRPAIPSALFLAPRIVTLGFGSRKGTPAETIDAAFESFCESNNLCADTVAKVCSIDLKRSEPGLLAFCEKRRLPLETFSFETLMEAPGCFSASSFVESVTGADNVCERSAVLGSGGRLLIGKTVMNGVTLAAAIREYTVDFNDGNKEHG